MLQQIQTCGTWFLQVFSYDSSCKQKKVVAVILASVAQIQPLELVHVTFRIIFAKGFLVHNSIQSFQVSLFTTVGDTRVLKYSKFFSSLKKHVTKTSKNMGATENRTRDITMLLRSITLNQWCQLAPIFSLAVFKCSNAMHSNIYIYIYIYIYTYI